MLAIMWGWK